MFARILKSGLLRAAAVLLSFAPIAAIADPVSELASFSVFPRVDLALLAKSEARPMRGAPMGNARFQAVETVWVAPGAPGQVAAAMRNVNPLRHPELKVLMQGKGTNFSQLGNLPGSIAVQWLVNATQTKPAELQISKAEAARGGSFAEFWSSVLGARSAAGVFGQPPYDHTGRSVRPGDEINALLAAQPKIKGRFGGLIGSRGEQSWELIEVESKGVFTLGASFSRTAGGGIQLGDATYYASGGFYAGLTFYQLWPVEVEGRSSTLVWRGDLVSSEELAGLRGVERMGSESAMIKNISRAVRIIRSDSGGSR